MIFDNFEIHATPFLSYFYCPKCKNSAEQISSISFTSVFFCPKCEDVYTIKAIQIPKNKIKKEFIEQCKAELKRKKE